MMDTLKEVLTHNGFEGGINLAVAALLGVIVFLAIVTVLHTFSLLGRRTLLYRKRQPVKGWNKQFYPANLLMICFIIGLILVLQNYRN